VISLHMRGMTYVNARLSAYAELNCRGGDVNGFRVKVYVSRVEG
jgi:hypothetical protein